MIIKNMTINPLSEELGHTRMIYAINLMKLAEYLQEDKFNEFLKSIGDGSMDIDKMAETGFGGKFCSEPPEQVDVRSPEFVEELVSLGERKFIKKHKDWFKKYKVKKQTRRKKVS